jgi:hypothetical protein
LGIALRHLKQQMKKALGVDKPTELSKSLRNLYRIAPKLNSLVPVHSEVVIGKYESAPL